MPILLSTLAAIQGDDIGTMEIDVYREPTMSAPEAVFFEATVTSSTGLTPKGTVYDEQLHELEFVWDFGASEEGTFQHVGIPSFFNRKRFAHGKHVGHVFETAGDKTITCTAYRVDYSGGTQTVTIVAQKTIELSSGNNGGPVVPMNYTDAEMIYIDPTETYAGAPAASPKYPDVATMFANGNPNLMDVACIRFARGQEHEFADTYDARSTGRTTFMDFGSGADPILRPSAGFSSGRFFDLRMGGINASNNTYYVRMLNLDIRLPWDIEYETGDKIDGVYSETVGVHLFSNVRITGANDATSISPFATDGTQDPEVRNCKAFFWNTWLLDFRNYGMYSGNDYRDKFFCWRGTRMTRSTRHAIGQYTNQSSSRNFVRDNKNAHGPIRLVHARKLHMESCQFFGNTGWFSTYDFQPHLRIFTSSPQDDRNGTETPAAWTPSGVFNYNLFEGGSQIAAFNSQGGDHVHYPQNVLLKHNLWITGYQPLTIASVARGGTSIVENYLIAADVPNRDPSFEFGFPKKDRPNNHLVNESHDFSPSDPSNTAEPVRIIGNTLVDLVSDANRPGETDANPRWTIFGDPAFDTVFDIYEERDNVRYAPNRTGYPATAEYGTPTTAITVNPLGTGPLIFNDLEFGNGQTVIADVAYPTSLNILAPGSDGTAVGAATGPMSRTDIFGTERPADASQGAAEPAV